MGFLCMEGHADEVIAWIGILVGFSQVGINLEWFKIVFLWGLFCNFFILKKSLVFLFCTWCRDILLQLIHQ